MNHETVFRRGPLVGGFIFILAVFFAGTTMLHAQAMTPNIALQSNGCTATHSGGGASPAYGPDLYNDGYIVGCNQSGTGIWGWTSGSSGPSAWIQFEWTSAQTFDEITLYYGQNTGRYLAGADIEVWANNSWVVHHTFLFSSPWNCERVISMNPVTTTKFRIIDWVMAPLGQTSNPNFREIEVRNTVTAPNDAGMASIDSPLNFCAGTYPITATLMNFGTNQITSVTVNWSLNGVPQTAINWTGLLDTLNAASRSTSVTLNPSYNFMSGVPYTITAWTSMPNNVADTVTRNDTISVTRQAALSGTFTIGGASPDYATFADAAADLTQFGLCGPVVFNVRSGTYNERIELDAIAGASATNTVTFQSETANRADVTVTYATTSANNGVLFFGGAKFVTFKNMTMRTSSTGTYTQVVNMGTSTDCTIESCDLIGATVTTTSNYAAVVYGYGSNNHRTTIRDCNIENGAIGMYMGGSSNTNTQDDCVYERNTINNSYYTGYYSYYQGFEKFHDNVINLGPGYSYMYPVSYTHLTLPTN